MKDFIIDFSIFIVMIVAMVAGVFWVSRQGASFQSAPNQQAYPPTRSTSQAATSATTAPVAARVASNSSSILASTQLQTHVRQQNSYASANLPKFKFLDFLEVGSSGTDVIELQKRLASDGFYSGPITGYYGAQTESAVRAFQKMHGIATKGYVGPSTRAALNAGE